MAGPTRQQIVQQKKKQRRGITPQQLNRLIKFREHAFSVIAGFKFGYRNKEDVSNLPPNVLVVGSQNVLTNAADQVGIRKGYTLDGPAGTSTTGTDSSYDLETHSGYIRNLRKWGANLEVRYLNPTTNTVSWISLLSNLSTTKVCNFTSFWDFNTELKTLCLFTNGDTTIREWTGAMAAFASSSNAAGNINKSSVAVNAGGTGYAVGDTVKVNTGNADAILTVATITGSAVATLTVTNPGTGYSNGTGTATTTLTGGGSGLTINYTVYNNAITIQGSLTTSQIGFYDNSANSSKFIITVDGTDYTYAQVYGETFQGLNNDPTLQTIAVGDGIVQKVATTATSGITSFPSNYNVDLISCLRNQVYYGSLTDRTVYISKVNNYKDVSFSTPRVVGEGALVTLDGTPVGFAPQDDGMYVSANRDQWYRTKFVLSSDNKSEALQINRLKTTFNQGALSQALIGKLKNSIVYVSNEVIFNALGPVKNVLADPQVVNLSDPIKYDFDAYNFTGGQVFYDNYFIYITIPQQGVVRIYNVQKKYWEAPQTLPVSRFYHVQEATGTALYAHSYLTNESYQMFTGYNDNGNPINAVAAFAYNNMSNAKDQDLRAIKKNFNRFYTEGYMTPNTSLTLTLNYDFGGFTSIQNDTIVGTDTKIFFNRIGDASLGKNPLGESPIGTIFNTPISNTPKFRKISTMTRQNFFEYQPVFSTNDVDQQWLIIGFGSAIGPASELPVEISE